MVKLKNSMFNWRCPVSFCFGKHRVLCIVKLYRIKIVFNLLLCETVAVVEGLLVELQLLQSWFDEK